MASARSRWAVLIGAGVLARRAENPLPGAATDVITMKEYLQTMSTDSTPIDIALLVVGGPADTNCSEGPQPLPLPTCQAVIDAFRRVIDLGQPGDYVYIHFAGHGTRLPETACLAIYLYDKAMKGHDLRNELVKMEDKGMQITLVLDCCFSGSVLRTPEDETWHAPGPIRFLEFDPAVDGVFDDDMVPSSTTSPQTRGAVMQNDPFALLKSDGYGILAACGPHESAREITTPDKKQHGALSYVLVQALRVLNRFDSQITPESLHRHICARFHAEFPAQTPMRYGNGGFVFFKNLGVKQAWPAFASIFFKVDTVKRPPDEDKAPSNRKIMLDAGKAHGVCVGDQFVAYPYYASESDNALVAPSRRQLSIELVVTQTGSLTSELAVKNDRDEERFKQGLTWKARRLDLYDPSRIRIRLTPSVPNLDREWLVRESKGHPYLSLLTEESDAQSACVFQVVMNKESLAYEIQTEACQRLSNLPVLISSSELTRNTLMTVLGHIAAFKYFERITNEVPDKAFKSSFELNDTTHAPGPDGSYDVKDGETWSMTLHNRDPEHPKYLAVFSFDSTWRVRNLVTEADRGASLVIEPQNKFPLRITMTAKATENPQQGGGSAGSDKPVEDIVKFFVTSKPTTFPFMILPSIGEDGVRGRTDQLRQLLQALRDVDRGDHEACWYSENFLIRTHPVSVEA